MEMRSWYNVVLALILSVVQMNCVYSQDPRWPVHTVCNSDKLTVTYTSCDPLQDIGLTFLPCPTSLIKPVKIRLALILWQPIDEFYTSLQLFLNDVQMLSRDEPLCLPHFPRFTFCGGRRGELITIESALQSKLGLPLKGEFNLKLHGTNQDGFPIICVNATLSFK